ncbi:MAG: VOC family protein, partial [Trueperaceae bacterium]|nr:VOC family protein [Trueperaceae bacterium]
MSDPFVGQVGAVLSADVAVPDHERELRFYARVLATGAQPLWRENLMNNLGLPIIGLGQRTEAFAKLPLQWMPHIQVADVSAGAGRAVEGGGTLLMESRSSDGTIGWAVLQDPNGAAFGIVPVVPPEALPPVDAVGSSGASGPIGRIAWLDLTVPDAVATRDFYRRVVGWSVEDVEMNDGDERYADFNMLREDGVPGAGVCHARGANADLPPVWLIYLSVGDLDESLRRVEEEGGTVLKAQRREDGRYVYAAVRDPVG